MYRRADDFEDWLERQAMIAAGKLAQCVSATSLVMARRGFGHTIRPAPGSVLASPETALSAGEPDYFFHWLRDSAAVMDAALALIRRGHEPDRWRRNFADFVEFSLGLAAINGRRFLENGNVRSSTAAELRKYLRSDAEIAAVEGDRVLGEVRYNADGTVDFLRWSRPQHDGPALRAIVCQRFWQAAPRQASERLAELIRRDLDYSWRHAEDPCFDIWEEELGEHYYTRLVQMTALGRGAEWVEARGDHDQAQAYRAKAGELRRTLDAFWSEGKTIYRSRIDSKGRDSAKALDISVILAVLHAGLGRGTHSILDPRIHSTLRRIEDLFAVEYAINRAPGRGLALGRYQGDTYMSGGAYYFSSFAAAELYYRTAAAMRAGASPMRDDASALVAKGDAILAFARTSIPASGELSEQYDQTTGVQSSAKNLSWSYAAFVTAWAARKAAIGGTR